MEKYQNQSHKVTFHNDVIQEESKLTATIWRSKALGSTGGNAPPLSYQNDCQVLKYFILVSLIFSLSHRLYVF